MSRATREQKAEDLFRKYKAALILKFGRGPLSTERIDEFGREQFGSKYGGSGDQSIELFKNKYYVVNTSWSPNSPGVHWVGIVTNRDGVVNIYDSFARNGSKLLPKLRQSIQKRGTGKHYIESDRSDKEQRINTDVCGHLSLAWLLVARDLGLRYAMLI